MHSYYYQAPPTKSSTEICEVKSLDGKLIGSIQRYFHSSLHRVIDTTIGQNNLNVRVKAMNPDGRIVIDAFCKLKLFEKPDYYITVFNANSGNKTFHARQLDHIKINPQFTIKHEDIEITSKTAWFEPVRFYERGQEIARWHSKAKEKFKTYIEIEDSASIQDPLFYAVLGHMLYFIGY